jgi:hypothetical protein
MRVASFVGNMRQTDMDGHVMDFWKLRLEAAG